MSTVGFVDSEKIIARIPKDDLIIIEDQNRLIVVCSFCWAYIHYGGVESSRVRWRCSDEDHLQQYLRPQEGGDSSILVLDDSSVDQIRRWAAYWIDVPLSDVTVSRRVTK